LSDAWKDWQVAKNDSFRRQCGWIIWTLPLLPREEISLDADATSLEFLAREIQATGWMSKDRHRAALVIAYYLRRPWSNAELIEIIGEAPRRQMIDERKWWTGLLRALGPEGEAVIARQEAEEATQSDKRSRSRRARAQLRPGGITESLVVTGVEHGASVNHPEAMATRGS